MAIYPFLLIDLHY